jgi:hypothetical protein
MKKTPLKRGTKTLKRTGFARKTTVATKKRAMSRLSGNKRKVKRPITKLKAKLWEECKRIVRMRYQRPDGTYRCYTCDALLEKKQCQTGHFIPSSVCSTEMRYDLGNLRIQCYRCNINLSGNWIEYEKRLNKEMGEDYTLSLKHRNETTKGQMYREEWYEMYIQNYKDIVK